MNVSIRFERPLIIIIIILTKIHCGSAVVYTAEIIIEKAEKSVLFCICDDIGYSDVFLTLLKRRESVCACERGNNVKNH